MAYEVELCYNYYSNRGDIVMYLESVPVLSAQVGGGHDSCRFRFEKRGVA